jgi:hypothetical protein
VLCALDPWANDQSSREADADGALAQRQMTQEPSRKVCFPNSVLTGAGCLVAGSVASGWRPQSEQHACISIV